MKNKSRKPLSSLFLFPLFPLLPLSLLLCLALPVLLPEKLEGQTATAQAPNCQLFFSFTGAGSTSAISNYGAGSVSGPQLCTFWTLAYANIGFSGLTLTVQSAPAGVASNVPGTWGTYGGTVVTGSNPNTSTTGAQTTLSNGVVSIPWVRVTLSGLTGSGTVFGILQGWTSGASGGGGGGGGSSGCVGTTMTPCVIAGVTSAGVEETVETDANGRILQGAYPTNGQIALSTSGLTQIITHSSTLTTTISHISVSFSAATNFQLEYGTGTNCGMGTTALTGNYQTILAIALDKNFFVPGGQDVCVNLGTSVTGGGLVVYSQP